MEKHKRPKCGGNLLSLFHKLRGTVFQAFDESEIHTTRTQQMILSAMESGKTLNMSELAKLINTSNEQATRAVSQLVSMGFIERSQNEVNHRVVNIRLTDKARKFMEKISERCEEIVTERLYGEEKADSRQVTAVCKLITELDEEFRKMSL